MSPRVSKRSELLELAVLGLLLESPMHGYELRKRLSGVLGTFHAISYGSLYPCLKDLVTRGWLIEDDSSTGASAPALSGKRARIVYRLTADGKEHFQTSASGSVSSVAPWPRCACASSKAVVHASRSASMPCGHPLPAPANASTTTPSSSSSTGSKVSSEKSAGSTSSSRASATSHRPLNKPHKTPVPRWGAR